MSSGPSSPSRPRSWPEPGQFNEAVQNLATTMSDRELQAGEPELNAIGLPSPYAGNFADVYKVHCPQTGNTWAVKFFKREVRDLRDRYRAISEQLIIAQLPFMTEFRYIEDGVRISGAWYPLVKMRWIEGQSLSRFVAQSLFQPKLLDQLFELWIKLSARLRGAGIAHADLQHGNVVLVPQGDQGLLLLKLIDYDGMFVPSLAGQASSELGHPNYQHPQREATRTYNAELDRFSHLAICTALRCLSVGGLPLWERFNTDDNVLFTARDFADPANSRLFRELWMLRNRDAHALVGHLALATQRPLEQTPLMEQLVRGGEVRPLTAAEQQEVDALLMPSMAAASQASTPSEPASTTVEPSPSARPAPANAAAAAAVPAPPAVVASPTQEIVDAELVRPSLLSLLLFPLLMLDRALASLAGGVQNALLHNFFRVVAASAAVGAGPAVYYAPTLWRDAAPSPVISSPIAELPDVNPEPPEGNPSPEKTLEPDPEPDVKPEPKPNSDKDPFVIEAEAPSPMPTPTTTAVVPAPVVLTQPATTRRRPFEELERSSDGLALLKLPPLPSTTTPGPTLLAQLRLDRAQDLELSLLGAGEVFSLVRRVDLEGNDASLPPGKLRSWKLTRSHTETGAFLPVKEQVAEFSLDADQKLAFAWGAGSVAKNHGALRYCLLELRVPTESVVCALGSPQEITLPAWSFNETNGIASLALPELDATTLPPADRLRVELSLSSGQVIGANPFPPDLRKESSSAGSEMTANSPRFQFTDGSSSLLEVKAALSYDPQSAGSGRLVFAPEFIKRVYKREGPVDEPTPASSSRLAKLRLECETEIKRLIAGRDSKKRLVEVERWNLQLAAAQERYAVADEAYLNATTPAAMASIERRMETINRDIERYQNLLDKRAQEDQESFDLQSFAENNRDRCDQALRTMSQLEKSPIGLRLFYELDVNATKRQVDILRTPGAAVAKTPVPPRGKMKGRR